MEYLVTGGAGFIGSNLTKELVRQGHRVYIIDDFSTGSAKNMPKEALHLGYKIPDVLEKFTARVDGIFHLGMPSSTPLYDEDRLLVGKVVAEGVSIFEWAKAHSVPRVVFATTSNLYLGNKLPWTEDMPVYPKTFYTEARYYVERLSALYYEIYKLSSIGLRFFSVYGPGEESKGNLANVITQMVWAKKLGYQFRIYGEGRQTRDSVYVMDVVGALLKAMEAKNIKQGIVNVGTGKSASFNDFAGLIGCKVLYVSNPNPNYVSNQLADTFLAERCLDFKAQVSLEEGIKSLLGKE